MVQSGEYLWNTGIFAWRNQVFLDQLAETAPEVATGAEAAALALAEGRQGDYSRNYLALPDIAVDHAVMERTRDLLVVEASFAWSDVGSWADLRDVLPADADGNAVEGDALILDGGGNVVHSDDRLVAMVGVSDLVVVSTDDAILVCPRDRVQEVKLLVAELKRQGPRGPRLGRAFRHAVMASARSVMPERRSPPGRKPSIKFGTDGWRGIIADDFTFQNVRYAAQGIANFLRRKPNPSVVIGYDCRFSADRFAAEVARTMAAAGIHTYLTDAPRRPRSAPGPSSTRRPTAPSWSPPATTPPSSAASSTSPNTRARPRRGGGGAGEGDRRGHRYRPGGAGGPGGGQAGGAGRGPGSAAGLPRPGGPHGRPRCAQGGRPQGPARPHVRLRLRIRRRPPRRRQDRRRAGPLGTQPRVSGASTPNPSPRTWAAPWS